MLQLAELTLKIVGGKSRIVHRPLPSDDPKTAAAGHHPGAQIPEVGADRAARGRAEADDRVLQEAAAAVSPADRPAVLVTGGAGYIGSHTCKALARAGYLPVTLDNLSLGHRWAVKWGPLEVLELGDLAGVTSCFAATGSRPSFTSRRARTWATACASRPGTTATTY